MAKMVLANMVRSGLYNITIEILCVLTIKLTQARATTRVRAMAMASSRARARDLGACLRLSARTVFAGGPNLT